MEHTSTGSHRFEGFVTHNFLPALYYDPQGVTRIKGSGTYVPDIMSRCIFCGASP